MMALSRNSTMPSFHLATIRPLAGSLYESTRRSTTLTKEIHYELGLLLSVLAATEARSSLLYANSSSSALDQKLESCHAILLDIKTLQNNHHGVQIMQVQVDKIRARISSLIFELNVMNADMMILSQNNVNRLLGEFISDVREGKREPSVITDVLNEDSPDLEKEQAWETLQQELHDVGIVPQLSYHDHDFILSTLREEVEDKELLKNIKPKPVDDTPPEITVSEAPPGPVENQAPEKSPPPLPPRPRDSGLAELSEKEVFMIIPEDLPIPTATELQGVGDTEKQALPIDNYPIPVATEAFFNAAHDSDKQALPRDNYPIPVSTEDYYSSPESNFDKQVVSQESPSVPTETDPSSHGSSTESSAAASSFTRGKKPSMMKKMKYRLTSTREDFISSIQTRNIWAVKKALDKGANVDIMNQDEQTALMVACSYGYEDIVKLLLQYGANTDKSSLKGETAIGVAAGRGQESIVRVLLAHGATVNVRGRGEPGLSEAAGSGYESIVRLLLDRGADPNNAMSAGGYTALSEAASNGYVNICRLLLDRGAKVDKTGYAGPRSGALWKAVHNNRVEVVSLLMERGADPLLKDYGGKTVVWHATASGRSEIMKIFHKYGYENTVVEYF